MRKDMNMNSSFPHERQNRYAATTKYARGFTLIEMIMVIVLLSLVAGIVGGKLLDNFNQGKYKAGITKMKALEGRIQQYYVDNGAYPASLNDLVTRPGSAGNWNGPYAKPAELKDTFDHTFQYKAPGEHGDFDLIFLGKDGQVGGDGLNKDVGNWE